MKTKDTLFDVALLDRVVEELRSSELPGGLPLGTALVAVGLAQLQSAGMSQAAVATLVREMVAALALELEIAD
jgi:hypothetical protein